jgi:hypothetical protein
VRRRTHASDGAFVTVRRCDECASFRPGIDLYSRGSLHLLTRKRISWTLFQYLLNDRITPVVGHVLARSKRVKSLLESDFREISGLVVDD